MKLRFRPLMVPPPPAPPARPAPSRSRLPAPGSPWQPEPPRPRPQAPGLSATPRAAVQLSGAAALRKGRLFAPPSGREQGIRWTFRAGTSGLGGGRAGRGLGGSGVGRGEVRTRPTLHLQTRAYRAADPLLEATPSSIPPQSFPVLSADLSPCHHEGEAHSEPGPEFGIQGQNGLHCTSNFSSVK